MTNSLEITEVLNKESKHEFIQFPVRLYKNNKHWVQPLTSDIEKVFDTEKNKTFSHGECSRYIVKDNNKQTVARFAVFVNNKTSKLYDQTTGGMGFFECIKDKHIAFAIFDFCKQWLEKRDCKAMDGPINFGERNQWWGLLVDGENTPNYAMPYNFKYYQDFFEDYGFKTFFKQYSYITKIDPNNLNKIIIWKSERLKKNPDYSIKHFQKSNLNKFLLDFIKIYNEAWAKDIPGVDGISEKQATALFKELEPIIEEKLMWFAYHKEEPIGFFLMMPDLNDILQHLNGKINLYGKLRFLYYKYIQRNKKAMGIIFGVSPKFQAKGIEAAMIYNFAEEVKTNKSSFQELEMSWVGDFNPRMMHLMEYINAKINKTHITYRYIFDRKAEFKRSPIIK